MKSGKEVVNHLSKYNIDAIHTFCEEPKEQRKQKMAFYMGDSKIKATTLHSFKGWESRCLIVYVTEAATTQGLALVYAGLTRIKRSKEDSWLTVICSAPELQDYGKLFNALEHQPRENWSNFEKK